MTAWEERMGRIAAWEPPGPWGRVRVIDAHAAGEPLRVILDGFEDVRGESILDMRSDARERLDGLRRALVLEPRGHADMYGCVVVPPVTERADFGVLFIHNEGFSTMCGHGIIAFTTVLVWTGAVPTCDGRAVVGIDTPAGFVEARAKVSGGAVEEVAFTNVPSFAAALDDEVDVPGLGRVRFDVAYGGAFYAYVSADDLGIALIPARAREIIEAGRAIKAAVAKSHPMFHPEDPQLGFLYGTIFTGPAGKPGSHGRHVCVFADGELDRSPTGTGVAGRLALMSTRGEMRDGEDVRLEGITGEAFAGTVLSRTRVGEFDAVVPEVRGCAHIVGRGELLMDPQDALADGFMIR